MSNAYKLLRDLLPDAPLQVGTITSSTNGVHTVELPGGGTVQARGVGTIGAQVYVRDNLVEGPAPALPIEVIEV